MPKSRWLIDELIKEKLEVALTMKKRINLTDFKILFTIPVEDDRILQLAKECGFRISKVHGCIVIELKGRGK